MTDRNYGAIKTADKFEAFVTRLLKAGKPIGFDIESGYTGIDKDGTALLTFHPEWIMVGFSFTNSTEWARYVPVAHDSGDNIDDLVRTARALWRMLWSGLGVAHNAHYELLGLSVWFRLMLWDDPEVGAEVRANYGAYPIRSDSMLEAFMVSDYELIGLKPMTFQVFGHKMVEFMDLFPIEETDMGPATPKAKRKYVRFNTRELVPMVIDYACEDAVWCLALHEKHYPIVKDQLMFRTELALLPVIVEMEQEGMYLDWAEIEKRAADTLEFKDLMNEEILAELSERLGEIISINLGSVPQLSEILFNRLGLPIKERSEKTNAPSTGESALRAIAAKDPVINQILKWREVGKLHGTYLKKYYATLNYAGTGRAHPNHKQTGAKTGRFAVDGVSYQQWPKPYHFELNSGRTFDLNYRDFMISPEGFRIVGYDFSQVELRVLAGMANETALLKAFAADVDIHKATASTMMGIPLEEVTKKQRSQGKTLNFAVVYGSGAQNIGELLGISKEEAQALLNTYFATFSGLKSWMDTKVAEGRQQGFVHTMFGRKFKVWEYLDPRDWVRSKGDRMCVNAPVQGGAADYMKLGMVRVNRAIKKAGLQDKIRLVMTVHDALEFYVHDSITTQEVIDLVQPAISFPVKGLPDIRADWHEGYKWGSVVEIKLDKEKKISGYALEDVDEEFFTIGAAYAHQAKLKQALIEDVVNEKVKLDSPKELTHGDYGTYPGEYEEDDTPMALVILPAETEEEPPWAHATPSAGDRIVAPPQVIRVSLVDMPNEDQWNRFEALLNISHGADTVVVEMPEGELVMDGRYSLTKDQQPMLSLMMGGASMTITAEEVDMDELMEGVSL